MVEAVTGDVVEELAARVQFFLPDTWVFASMRARMSIDATDAHERVDLQRCVYGVDWDTSLTPLSCHLAAHQLAESWWIDLTLFDLAAHRVGMRVVSFALLHPQCLDQPLRVGDH